MRVKMQTESGAVYVLDFFNHTWSRVGRVPIIGLDRHNGGFSPAQTYPRIGFRYVLVDTKVGIINTTKVVRLELLDDSELMDD